VRAMEELPFDIRTITSGDESDTRYRGTWLITNTFLLGPYRRTTVRVLWWSQRGWLFLTSEVPLYGVRACPAPPLPSLPSRCSWPWVQDYLAHKKSHPPRTLP
jgi:hypothetical protein